MAIRHNGEREHSTFFVISKACFSAIIFMAENKIKEIKFKDSYHEFRSAK